MDVHRCRFVPYPAAEINALAFSHQSNPNEPEPPQLRLALGRSNGDIEIWNPLGGAWAQETVLRGGKNRTIEGLAWTQDPEGERDDGGEGEEKKKKKTPGKLRLFSIGYSPVVTEWDLATGRPARQSEGAYGDVWCMAAQPQAARKGSNKKKADKKVDELTSDQKQEQLLALGCDDGSIVLLSTADGDLTYLKTLPRSSGKRARVISLAWNGRDQVIAGYSDSMIRVYDITGRGSQKASMSLGANGKRKAADTLVWNIRVLRDETFVSADSTGEVKIWDSRNFTLLQRIKGHLDADVLSLAVSYDGTMLFSGGMDRRTTMYQKTSSGNDKERPRWAVVSHQRYHQSDVKAMVTFESKQMSVLASCGADAMPIINPLRDFGQQHHRGLSPIASSPVVDSAPNARLIVSWWDREVNIWHIPSRSSLVHAEGEAENDRSTRRLVARIAIKGEDTITSASTSLEGDMIVVATNAEIKLFHLRPSKVSNTLRVQKVDVPESMSNAGSKLVQFSPDSKWLAYASVDNSLQLFRVVQQLGSKQPYKILNSSVTFERRHGHTSERVVWGTHENYDHVIVRLAWSEDSRILVAGDLSGTLETWTLEGNEDADRNGTTLTNGTSKRSNDGGDSSEDEDDDDNSSDEENHPQVIMGQHWKRNAVRLPVLPTFPLVISFRPRLKDIRSQANGDVVPDNATHDSDHDKSHEDRLLVVTAKHEILEYHVTSGKMSAWSRRNATSTLPLAFRNVLDRAMGCLWDISEGKQRLFLYGSMWVWMFDLVRDFPITEEPRDAGVPSQDLDLSAGNGLKRKRELTEREKRHMIKKSSGAGSSIPEEERSVGAGASLILRDGAGGEEAFSTIAFASNQPSTRKDEDITEEHDENEEEEEFAGFEDESDVERSDEEESRALVKIRRAENETLSNGETYTDAEGREDEIKRPIYEWHTFKYRPILGIALLADQARPHVNNDEAVDQIGGENSVNGIEVAIIERPLWDVDLKPRWEGPQEWGER